MKNDKETDTETVEVLDASTSLMALTRGEIDMQIATARAYPRSLKKFLQDATALATVDEDTAASMFYKVPRGGKIVEGPSARLAEVVVNSWGNCRAESDIVSIDDKFVTAMGSFMDLEKNVAIRIRVKRRITTKDGKRFNEDMIQTTCGAACSIAFRDATFKVIPRSVFNSVYAAAKAAAIGDIKTLSERRHKACEWFVKAGIPMTTVLEFLGRKGIEEVNLDDLETLTGMKTAAAEGMSLDALFKKSETETADKVAEVNAKLKAKKATIQAAKTTPEPKAELKNGGTHGALTEEDIANFRLGDNLHDTETDEYVGSAE